MPATCEHLQSAIFCVDGGENSQNAECSSATDENLLVTIACGLGDGPRMDLQHTESRNRSYCEVVVLSVIIAKNKLEFDTFMGIPHLFIKKHMCEIRYAYIQLKCM